MEGSVEHDDIWSARCNLRNFDRVFQCLRALVCEVKAVNRRRDNLAQFLDQSQYGFMNDDVCLRVQEKSGLLTDRFNDFRVAVARIRHADSACEIKQFPAVIGVDVRAFGAVCNKVENAAPGGSHVGEVILVEGVCWHGFFRLGRCNW